jgi:anti-sigma factor RsiW
MSELDERSDIELLLPWYVTGRLDAADKARIEAYLAVHPEMQSKLALAREEHEQAVRGNEALGGPRPQAIDRVMAQIARERPWRLSLSGLWEKVWQGLAAPTPQGVRWATVAAGVLILLQAAAIGALLTARSPDSYQTASGPSPAQQGFSLLIGFTDQATAPEIASLLTELGAQIVEGPKPGSLYRIRLQSPPESELERQQLVHRLLLRKNVVRIVLLGTG